MNIGKK